MVEHPLDVGRVRGSSPLSPTIYMRILAIETSCDETAVAILDITGPRKRPDIKILGNSLYSQAKLHEKYGGVYPNLAKREHEKNLPILLEKTLREAEEDLENPNVDYIAVTQGPGLEPALWTGITFAEDLGRKWQKPVVPVDHMEGHIYSVLYNTESNSKSEARNSKLELPALALLVSGGHTELVLVKDFCNYEILGQTRDDAVGEAFDKVARMLDLPYPGGPKISALAQETRTNNLEPDFKFPRPMIHSGDLDFSYSGLKTAVLYHLKGRQGKLGESDKQMVARAFEDAAIGVLVEKTRQALEKLQEDGRGVKTLIVAGGVSANTHLIEEVKKIAQDSPGLQISIPDKTLATDNAVMIGIAAYIRQESYPQAPNTTQGIRADGNLALSATYRKES